MKKIATLVSIVILMCINAKAQTQLGMAKPIDENNGKKTEYKFGIFAGMNIANMALDEAFIKYNMGDTLEGAVQKARVGLRIGGDFQIKFNKLIGIQVELLYNQTGYTRVGTYQDTQSWEYKAKTSVHSLCLGVMLQISPLKWMAIDLGAQPGVNLSVTNNIQKNYNLVKLSAQDSYHKDGYNLFGCDIIAGLTFYPTKHLFITARYNYGFIDILKIDTPYYYQIDEDHSEIRHIYTKGESKNRTAQISIGYIF